MRTFSPRQRPEAGGARSGVRAFSLIELLVTMAVLSLVLVVLLQFTTDAEQNWKRSSNDPFAEAADAFETIVSHAAAATLETYQDYADSSGAFRTSSSTSFTPDHVARRSDLAFVCGPSAGTAGWLNGSARTTVTDSLFFLAPQGYTQTEAHLGLERLLNALGYFVEFSDETNAPTFIVPGIHRWRWRLKEVVQPSESLGIYALGTSLPWVQSLVQLNAQTSILAENVVALVVVPEWPAAGSGTTLSSSYSYDSRDTGNSLTRDQLPSRLRLALVAIDESSAQVLAAANGAQAPALVPGNLFTNASSVAADLATLDAALTSARVRHRILQRDIALPAAAWSQELSQ